MSFEQLAVVSGEQGRSRLDQSAGRHEGAPNVKKRPYLLFEVC